MSYTSPILPCFWMPGSSGVMQHAWKAHRYTKTYSYQIIILFIISCDVEADNFLIHFSSNRVGSILANNKSKSVSGSPKRVCRTDLGAFGRVLSWMKKQTMYLGISEYLSVTQHTFKHNSFKSNVLETYMRHCKEKYIFQRFVVTLDWAKQLGTAGMDSRLYFILCPH